MLFSLICTCTCTVEQTSHTHITLIHKYMYMHISQCKSYTMLLEIYVGIWIMFVSTCI